MWYRLRYIFRPAVNDSWFYWTSFGFRNNPLRFLPVRKMTPLPLRNEKLITCFFYYISRNELDYLALRLWIGVWIGIILIILVAVDASAFVCYITRFTEENFALLIATIFIYKVMTTFGIHSMQCKFNSAASIVS